VENPVEAECNAEDKHILVASLEGIVAKVQ
jgi:hypothetical protein